ncbi:MAG: hypothetical protein SPK10_00600 [Treponema sp.]|nr:hypothetical protein [Treponema sp.]
MKKLGSSPIISIDTVARQFNGYANVFLGLKGVKVLRISIGEIGKEWEWNLFKKNMPIIPETKLFECKIN